MDTLKYDTCVIVGKSPTLDNELISRYKHNGALILTANNPLCEVKPDVCFMQDCIIGDFGQKLNVCVSTLEERKINEHIPREYYLKTLDVTDNENGLCFYPYTGVACLHWALRKGFKKVIVTGFSFENNHNHINGYVCFREQHCLNIYKRNCAEIIVKMIKSGVQIQGDEILNALKPIVEGLL